ncbi:MAG: hypothetical protein RLZ53_155 [Actinomycetota bacterium]|jgi:hypothetical protein
MLPLAPDFALIVAILVTVAFCLFVYFSSPVLLCDGETLAARNAEIPLNLLGKATVIERESQFEELGPNLDARAWLCIQASVKKLVKIELNDPNDPTPYWLVTTRRPEELAALINKA